MDTISVSPQGVLGKFADACMVPFMYLAQGNLIDSPQRTHFWNNKKLSKEEASLLLKLLMVECGVDQHAVERWWGKFPMFHIPLLGGWRRYVVVEPSKHHGCVWYPGWDTEDSKGVSKIPIKGPVRLLLGSKRVQFFGVDSSGNQKDIKKIGEGIIGVKSRFSKLPLR